jgi:hypothetical protein
MDFQLDDAIAVLSRTPATLDAMLRGLPEPWVRGDEGPETFSAFDVVGHLIHGERTDWMPRLRRILEHGTSLPFEPFDRFAQRRDSEGKSLEELLDTFARLRAANLEALREVPLEPADYDREGLHPGLGRVTLRQLLSTWVAHDLGHIAQAARVMAKQYKEGVGPWIEYLPVLTRK